MSAKVDFFTTESRTYEIQRYNTTTEVWDDVASAVDEASIPYVDTEGTTTTYYRVRDDTDVTPSPWTPKFLGLSVTPSICSVKGYIYDLDGTPTEGAEVWCYTLNDQIIDGIHPSIVERMEANTDSDGLWEQDLVQNAEVYVKIPDLGIREQITVPESAEVNFDSLI